MTNKEFETKVLGALEGLNTRFDWLEGRFDWLEKKVDDNFTLLDSKIDRLDNKIDDQTFEIKNTINAQWKYINQAFEVIARIQNEKVTK